MKLSFSLLLCSLVSLSGFAQKEPKPDSLKIKFYLRSLRIGTDLLSIIKTQVKPDFNGWEINGDVDFGRYYLAIDYGHSSRSYKLNDGGDYNNKGTYWRVGGDINLLTKDPDRNMFFFGFRYGTSNFQEASTFIDDDPYFGTIKKEFVNSSVTSHWAELTTGLRVKIWKEFWMGYTARLKFAPSAKGGSDFTTYEIPGYGLYQEKFYWGFNYQIFWRFPLKKEKLSRG